MNSAELLRQLKPALSQFWREKLNAEFPIETLEKGYLSFALWIAEERRRLRPDSLFVVGVQGSIGRGKSVLNRVLCLALNELLRDQSLVAVGCSLDDYYLTLAERQKPEFLAKGYNPPGISNRGPAGTHDVALLERDIRLMEEGKPVTLLQFDKQRDDRATKGLSVSGRVGVFILDGWFLGAAAPPKEAELPAGLKRSVGQALESYQKIFKRLDALWSFESEALTDITAHRIQQQKSLDLQSGRSGMTEDQIKHFVQYFYNDSWVPGLTSPQPPADRISFHAKLDASYHLVGSPSRGPYKR